MSLSDMNPPGTGGPETIARLEARLERIFEAEADDFLSLAEIGGFLPGEDFRGADLRALDLSGENLSAFDFTRADLRGADLRGARLYRDALAGARLEGAKTEGIVWLGRSRGPLFGGASHWIEVRGQDAEEFIEQIDPVDGKLRLSAQTARIQWRRLPFYDQAVLVAAYDRDWENESIIAYYLSDQGRLFRLNGTSPPIHEVNNEAPIGLSEENVLDYLRFNGFFVRGDLGPFYILEDVNDPNLPEDMDRTTHSVIEGTARPAAFEGKNEQGHFLCDAVVLYDKGLFIANYAVQQSGMIEMLTDEPIAGDLNASIRATIA